MSVTMACRPTRVPAETAVPGATIRHGRILGSPTGDADAEYYFEFEFPDREAWKASQDGLVKSAEDAQERGLTFKVYFADVG